MSLTRLHCPLACLSALLAASIVVAQAPPDPQQSGQDGNPPPADLDFGPPDGGPPGRGPGGMGGPNAPERKILKDYDKDKNGRLEGAERDAARVFLKENPARGPGGPGGRGGMRGPGGPGGPGGARAETKPGPKVAPADVQKYPDAPLFAENVVRTFFIDFDVPNWEEELELFHNTDAEVPANLTVDGKTYAGVGVHFRGASSYMMVPRGGKRSFNISVDHTDPQARLYGQNTLNLLNCNGDASMMSSVLYGRLASPHIAAPKANWVHVVVNGESWGVFVNIEQFNKTFLKERWPDFKGDGARWKVMGSPNGSGGLDYRGEAVAPYKQRYEIKTKDDEKDWKDLIHLCKVLSETPTERLEAAITPILDVDSALWFIALDVATANSDGYWTRASDYSLYKDPRGVFHVVPHDMNEAFKLAHGGPGGRGGPGGLGGPGGPGSPGSPGAPEGRPGRGMRPRPADAGDAPPPKSAPGAVRGEASGQEARPPQDGAPQRGMRGPGGPGGGSMVELDPLVGMDDKTKPLRSKLLAVPAFREKYLGFVRQIATEMTWEMMGPAVGQYRALLSPLVAKDTRKPFTTEAFDRDTSPEPTGTLRQFFEKRSKFLLEYKPKPTAPKD